VFDEAHRLTPTSQYLGASAQLAERSHHLLLLTATPTAASEHFFRALLHLLDPGLYPWDEAVKDDADAVLRPGRFLPAMKTWLSASDRSKTAAFGDCPGSREVQFPGRPGQPFRALSE
jgi:hypothetical protein